MFDKIIQLFRNIKASLQAKITISTLLLTLLIAMGGAYVLTNLFVRHMNSQFNRSLQNAANTSAYVIVQAEDLLLETLRLVANTDGIWEVIAWDDAEALREMVYPLVLNSNEDLVAVLGLDGKSVLTLRKGETGGEIGYQSTRGSAQFGNLFFVKRILSNQQDSLGDKYAEIIAVDGEMTLLIAGPIRDRDGQLAGVVVVGRLVEALVADLKRETPLQVSLYRLDGQLWESTLFNQTSMDTQIAKEVIENQGESGYLRNYELQDHPYRELVSVFELRGKQDYGLLGITSSTSMLEKTFHQARNQTFFYLTILLTLTMLTGITLTRWLVKKIQPAGHIHIQVDAREGSHRLEPIGEEEINILTQAYNAMILKMRDSHTELLRPGEKSLESLAQVLDARHQEAPGHTQQVTNLALALAQALGVDGIELENIRRGALLHDIGKVGVPDQILRKTNELTPEEFDIIKEHPQVAYEMLSEIPFLEDALDIPYCHHEKWDGNGYPRNLETTEIPLAARIFTVVDVWDAINTDQVYRGKYAREVAIQLILDSSGSHFDPMVVDAFIHHVLPAIEIN